jgi:hypothetical protein
MMEEKGKNVKFLCKSHKVATILRARRGFEMGRVSLFL